MLGGSSAINALAIIAPSKIGIDNWGKLGNPGWNWEAMEPYYKKFQTFHRPSKRSVQEELGITYLQDELQGTGPIQTVFPETSDTLTKAWVDTFKNLKYELAGDPFSGYALGGFCNPSNIHPKTRERSYVVPAYYSPAKNRPNLHVITEAFVERILLSKDGDQITAHGVQFLLKGEHQTIKARKEVILSAGAFQSPQLLELSGIGAAPILHSHNIEVLIDNSAVGENLQDHLIIGISLEVDNLPTLDDLSRDPRAAQAAMQTYLTDRNGPFAGSVVQAFGFMPVIDDNRRSTLKQLANKYLDGREEPENPNDHLTQSRNSQYKFIRSILEDPSEASASLFVVPTQMGFGSGNGMVNPTPASGNYITIGVSLLQPFSRGSVHIDSPDPSQKPMIDPRYLSHPLDVEVFTRHIQYLETILETQPLASLLKKDGRRDFPSVKDFDVAKGFLRSNCISNWHPTSTCAMMPRQSGGVVNERFIVHGTRNLRVVDASIFPVITRGNPQSSVYAIAERAADFIKEQYGYS